MSPEIAAELQTPVVARALLVEIETETPIQYGESGPITGDSTEVTGDETITGDSTEAGTITTGPLRVWQGDGNIRLDDVLWLGMGRLGSVSAIERPSGDASAAVTLALSGLDSTIVNLIKNARLEVQRKPCRIFLGVWSAEDPDAGFVYLGKIALFTGFVDVPSFTLDTRSDQGVAVQHTYTASFPVEPIFSLRRTRSSSSTYSDVDQKRRYPLDKGLEYLTVAADRTVEWPLPVEP